MSQIDVFGAIKNINTTIKLLSERITALVEKVESIESVFQRHREQIFDSQKKVEALEAMFREFSGKGEYLEVKKILQEEKEVK